MEVFYLLVQISHNSLKTLQWTENWNICPTRPRQCKHDLKFSGRVSLSCTSVLQTHRGKLKTRVAPVRWSVLSALVWCLNVKLMCVVGIYHACCRTNVWPKLPATQTHSDPDCLPARPHRFLLLLRSLSEANEKYSSTNLSTKARRKWRLSLLVPLLWSRSATQERRNVITSRR